MKRHLGIAFGLATQLLFLFTVVRLFQFLDGGHLRARAGSLWLDAMLALQFAVPHSVLLAPSVRQRLRPWIASAFYGSLHCCLTCISLLLVFTCWRSNPRWVWSAQGMAASVIHMAFLLSWAALFYSLWISGLGRQTGWTTWYAWLRHRPASAPQFAPRSWYRWLRHPIYLSFLGLIWFTPQMTLDRFLLTAIWTVYIFVGSCLKDARLELYLGDPYRDYQTRVPGYPFILFGPLGRQRPAPTSAAAPATQRRAA